MTATKSALIEIFTESFIFGRKKGDKNMQEQVSHGYHLWRDRLAQEIRGGPFNAAIQVEDQFLTQRRNSRHACSLSLFIGARRGSRWRKSTRRTVFWEVALTISCSSLRASL